MSDPDVKINLNRGVTMRKEPASGITVCMYKDQPGIFMDLKEKLLPTSFAKDAGFDIKALEKQKDYNKAIGEAQDSLSKEYSGVEEKEVLITEGPFEAKKAAHGTADVYRDGEKMNVFAMKQNEAINLVKKLSEQETVKSG